VSVARDWTWAEETAEGIHRICSAEISDDFLLSTGVTHSLQDIVYLACEGLNLDPDKAVRSDTSLFRPSEIESMRLNPLRAKSVLGWSSKKSLSEIVEDLIYVRD
jgi:GDPmannose 4,6-dehydratase